MEDEISLVDRTPSLIKFNNEVRESLIEQSPSIYDYIVSKMFAIIIVAVLVLVVLLLSNKEVFNYVFGNGISEPATTD